MMGHRMFYMCRAVKPAHYLMGFQGLFALRQTLGIRFQLKASKRQVLPESASIQSKEVWKQNRQNKQFRNYKYDRESG